MYPSPSFPQTGILCGILCDHNIVLKAEILTLVESAALIQRSQVLHAPLCVCVCVCICVRGSIQLCHSDILFIDEETML